MSAAGAEAHRCPNFFLATKSLDGYLNLLAVRNRVESSIAGNRRFLTGFVNTCPIITPGTNIEHLSRHSHITQNSRDRYASYLKCFLRYLGHGLNIKVKCPALFLRKVYDNDIIKLKEAIKNQRIQMPSPHKILLLVETAMKTGLRRTGLSNLHCDTYQF